jgi:zinc transporter
MTSCRGLLWARRPDALAPLNEAEVDATLRGAPAGGGLWLHLDLVDSRARSFLQTLPCLPPFARDALVDRAEVPHLEVTGDVLWGAVPDFHQDVDGPPDPERMGLLQIVLTPTLLVTARRHPLRATHQSNATAGPGLTPAARWDHIMRSLLDGILRASASLGGQLDTIEEALLRDQHSGRAGLAALRRAVLQLHRRVEPLAHLYEDLAEFAPAWMAPAGHDAARMARRMEAALRVVQGLQERGRIAQDELASRTAEEANRRLLTLSVLTAVLLPPTLVAGIFGMNTTDLPGTAAPGGFWWAMAAILGSGIVALLGMLRLLDRR